MFFKLHFVFNVDYHPNLKNFLTFIEHYVYEINDSHVTATVAKVAGKIYKYWLNLNDKLFCDFVVISTIFIFWQKSIYFSVTHWCYFSLRNEFCSFLFFSNHYYGFLEKFAEKKWIKTDENICWKLQSINFIRVSFYMWPNNQRLHKFLHQQIFFSMIFCFLNPSDWI